MRLRSWVAILALMPGICHAAPDLLIVQTKVPVEADRDPNLMLAPYVADELDKEGRVRPVVWSMTDPVFREWTSRDVFGPFEPNPSPRVALDTARKLGIDYVLIVQAVSTKQQFVPSAELFVDGRSKWKFGPRDPKRSDDLVVATDGKYDEKATRALQAKLPDMIRAGGTFTVYVGSLPDWDATARSVSSTWRALLGEGPLASLPARPRVSQEPDPTGAEVNTTVEISGAADPDLPRKALDMAQQGKADQAVILVREACDLKPFDTELRKTLVAVEKAAGLLREAADASQLAAKLDPGDSSLWLLAASSWIDVCDAERARDSLKEAQARGASGPEVNRIEADIALLGGEAKKAEGLYVSLKDPSVVWRLALAAALAGDLPTCEKALESLQSGPLEQRDYQTLVLLLDRSLEPWVTSVRDLVPMVRMHPGDPQALQKAETVNKVATGLADIVSKVVAPERHKESHEARRLAHILLAQSTLEALHFAKSNDPDTGEEAVASLGQALRLFPGVKEKFNLELKYGGS